MTPRDIALALLIAGLWGANFVVMKHAVSEVPPLLLTAVRFALAAIPAVFFIPRPDVSWGALAGFGAVFGIVKFGLLFTAFKLGGAAGIASVLLQMQVFFTILLGQAVLGEALSTRQKAGIVVAMAGMLMILTPGLMSAAAAPAMLILAAALAWAVANLILKSTGKIDMLGFTVWSSLVPPLPMLTLSAVVEGTEAWHAAWTHLTWVGLAAVLYLAYPISILSGTLWGNLMARYTTAQVAPFALLVPVVGLAGGAWIYGEPLTLPNLGGSALILAGLAVIVLAGRRALSQKA
jgi:O-acetylserine/cysteine efflux transporter